MEASAARGHPVRSKPAPLTGRLLRLASDERLVAHVRHGSEPAFEAIYDRHHRGVLSFCRHMLGDPGEAEDAVQHTFMAAYRDLVGSDKAIQLKPWLYTIARNRCLSVLRARRERPSDDLDQVSTFNLAAEVQQRQDLRDLLRDLGGLPEDQRAALVLAELGDVSHDEIAAVLGCQREKVKALVFQARSSLAASRKARDADCTEIREQLATLRGGALRRNTLRRHLKECAGCRAFATEVRDQRKLLAAALPVLPTLGLKENALAAAFGGSGAAAGGATAGAAAGVAATGAAATGAGASGGALAVKALLVVALASSGTAAGVSAIDGGAAERPAASQDAGKGPGGDVPAAPAAAGGQETAERARSGDTPIRRRVRKHQGEKGNRGSAKGHQKGKARGLALGHDPDRGVGGDVRAQREAQRQERAAARQERQAARREEQQAARQERQPAKPVTPAPEPNAKPAPTAVPTSTPEPEQPIEPEGATGGGSERGARGARGAAG